MSNPALAQLDPALLKAIQDAPNTAKREGIDLRINSGWRSTGFQQRGIFELAVDPQGNCPPLRPNAAG